MSPFDTKIYMIMIFQLPNNIIYFRFVIITRLFKKNPLSMEYCLKQIAINL